MRPPRQEIEARLKMVEAILRESQAVLLASGHLLLKTTHHRSANGFKARKLVDQIELLAGPVRR